MERRDVDTTTLLSRATEGDPTAADRLLPRIYRELHALAVRSMQREDPGHTLQPTALVHEAYLRLVDQTRVEWQGRTHFLAVAATEIRRILVDHSRRRNAVRRGGGRQREALGRSVALPEQGPVDLVALDDALVRLKTVDERQSRVVELRFFGGLSIDETAQTLDVSPRTVDGDWQMARAWLHRELTPDAGP